MCIRDRNTSTYSPPEDGSRQPTRFSEASRRELAETENLLRVETQHAAPDEAGVCALFRWKRLGKPATASECPSTKLETGSKNNWLRSPTWWITTRGRNSALIHQTRGSHTPRRPSTEISSRDG